MILVINFREITKCQVSKGLLDLTDFSDAICSHNSNILKITNFKTYSRSKFSTDYLEILFTGVLPTDLVKVNPIEIYTYTSSDFVHVVDQNINSENTRLKIISAPTNSGSSSIASSSLIASASTTLTIIIQKLTSNYANQNIIKLEISRLFTGIPTCQCKLLYFFLNQY